jgi:hypothetical protein
MDFVLLWVDDKDPHWRADYEKYSLIEIGEKRECRFRDWENLHYWFRGVENFAPWVDRIFLILASPSQVPEWLNTNHPKLRIVYHEEYIPKEILPTFNSNTIEMFLHKIPDLSEQFVLFNDDFFIINKVKPERFFRKGLPVDICAMNAYGGQGLSCNNMCNLEVINKHFNKKEVMKKSFFKWVSINNNKYLLRTFLLVWWPYFVGFYDHHLPQPFLKSILKEVWEKEHKIIIESIKLRFRQKTNLTQYLYRYWQLVSNQYTCRNIFSDSIAFQHLEEREIKKVINIIRHQQKKIVVINDSDNFNFDLAKEQINDAFENILPNKSTFEK